MNTENKWLNITNAANDVAKIDIHGVIGGGWFEDGVTSEQVEADLKEISEIKAKTIEVSLKSGGGSVIHGIEIYNLLKENPAKIVIKGQKIVASIATVIAMAADEGQFSMIDNSFFLIHEGRMPSGGTASQLKKDAEALSSINDTIADIYSENLNLSREEALAIMAINGGEGELITAKEANKRGYVDSVYKPTKGNATASITQEQLNEYKIKAEIMSEKNEDTTAEVVIEKKPFDMGEVVAEIVAAVKDAVNPVEKEIPNVDASNEVNIEELVSAQVNEAVKSIEDANAVIVEAKQVEFDELKAKYDVLNAGSSDIPGADAVIVEDKVVVSDSDKAAAEFKNALSNSDKLEFASNEKK